ncbi:hypothetical protein [Microseira wollei]|uniref:hypothetical protein n=1 Tax=Microseira wollei TaxID=467598 RepID=UPI001CFE355B|nr:hypothetical protein [Microseira wollei]
MLKEILKKPGFSATGFFFPRRGTLTLFCHGDATGFDITTPTYLLTQVASYLSGSG